MSRQVPVRNPLTVGGARAGAGTAGLQVPSRFSLESLDVGMDCLSAVGEEYGPTRTFPFTGRIERVDIAFPTGKSEMPAREAARIKAALD